MNRPALFGVILLAHFTAACATTSPEMPVQVVEVARPTAVTCVPENLPPAPKYRVTREAILAAPDAAARYVLAVIGMEERDARSREVEPVIEGCRAPEAQ